LTWYCPNCRVEFSDYQPFCPYCNKPLRRSKRFE
jgi:predicted amidophosphoribosyltransferase